MKNVIKNVSIFILGIIISCIVSVYAVGQIYSKDVTYDNSVSKLSSTDVQGALDELYSEATDYSALNQKINEIQNKIYPVGSIYISTTLTSVTDVQNTLGGTWEAYGAGRTLVGVNTSDSDFNAVGKTGGEKTHTLTVAEMPSHTHMFPDGTLDPNAWVWEYGPNSAHHLANTHQWTSTTMATGGNGAHNNMQPYITVYMYKRTK